MARLTAAVEVLVVEDDPQMGVVLERGLRAEGYAVTFLADGVRALIHADDQRPQIAVLDVMLPGMSGFELCRRLREMDPAIRVLMLTARDDVDDRVHGLDAGADDYLVKPFEFRELAARLRALQRRDTGSVPVRLTVGGVTLDSVKRGTEVDGQALHLSPKEFALLRVLMARAGATVTRDEILGDAWGTTSHADPNLVDQYVSYLRRKLTHAHARIAIRNERGVGFCLVALT